MAKWQRFGWKLYFNVFLLWYHVWILNILNCGQKSLCTSELSLQSFGQPLMALVVGSIAWASLGRVKFTVNCWLMQHWLLGSKKGWCEPAIPESKHDVTVKKNGLVITFDFQMFWSSLVNGFNSTTFAVFLQNYKYS